MARAPVPGSTSGSTSGLIPVDPPAQLVSKLDAVNMMLALVGEQPISTEEDITRSGITSVLMAHQQLTRTSLVEQAKGWEFNTEEDVLLDRANDGRIARVENALHVTAMDPRVVLVLRNGHYYDKARNTHMFPEDMKFRVIRHLDWEDLIPQARIYIMTRAARVFQRRLVGDISMERLSQDEEEAALTELRCADSDLARHSFGF